MVHWSRSMLAVLGLLTPSFAQAGLSLDCESRSTALVLLPPSGEQRIEILTGSDLVWLEAEEAGVDAEIEDAPPGTFKVTVPTRYGRHFVPVIAPMSIRLRRVQSSNVDVVMSLKLLCGVDEKKRVDWYRQAAVLSSELMPVPSGKALGALLDEAARLQGTAEDPGMQALVKHLGAQSLYASNRTKDSSDAFGYAETAWLRAGDRERALAARVGRVEELIRVGDYATALSLVTTNALASTYFSNRLASSRCQILRYRGRLREAMPCYSARIMWLRAQGEKAEAASMLLDQADVYRQLGRTTIAEKQANEARRIAEGPYAPLVRGRADLMLYDLLLDRGNVAAAIERVRTSMDEFSRIHASRWEANALLRAAWLYARMGAFEEARLFLERAREILPERDAPARIAAAWMLEADISRRTFDFAGALRAAHMAKAIYSRLGMPVEMDGADVLTVDVQLSLEDDAAIRTIERHRLTNSPAWLLLRARLAVLRGQERIARRSLDQLRKSRPLRFTQEVERMELECRWLALANALHAERCARDAARQIFDVANSLGNVLLRRLMKEEVAPLRGLSIELMAGHGPRSSLSLKPNDGVVAAWEWLTVLSAAHDAQSFPATSVSITALNRFDGLVAAQLLGRDGDARVSAERATRSLLDIMSEAHRVGRRSKIKAPPVSLRAFQATLQPDTVFMAYLPAGRSARLLWVTRDDARIDAGPSPQELKARIDTLVRSTSRPEMSMADLNIAATALFRDLVRTAPRANAPAKLLVAAGAELSAIPWPVLHWGDDDEPLVERTDVSQIWLEKRAPLPKSHTIRVVVAQQTGDERSELPALPGADSEDLVIKHAIRESAFQVAKYPVAGREALFAAWESPGDWIHLVGHGQSQVDRIGYSGIWLDPPDSDVPEFIGGLDLVGHSINSELVVLDSCELGRRGQFESSANSLTFSDSITRAGARNVISALWQVSDAATATWVSTFYESATRGSSEDFGRALREAQIRLRHSRRYRHPYYWASMFHAATLAMDDIETADVR